MGDIKQLSKEARKNLKYNVPLASDSEMLVDLNGVRGNFSLSRLFWTLGVEDDEPLDSDDSKYILFGGHVGCGKSTVLRQLEKQLHRPDRYFVVFIDTLKELDINELRYSDILLAQAKVLFEKLEAVGVKPDSVHVTRLENWFKERIEAHEELKEVSAELKSTAKAEVGFPFVAKLMSSLTGAIRTNSTYKTTVRNLVRNAFTEFSDAFNALLLHIESKIRDQNLGQKILFIVDGTDRLQGDDADKFFKRDAYQLKQIRSSFVYCTPIDLLCEEGLLNQHFDDPVRLPMIKIAEKNSTTPIPAAIKKLRSLVYLRVSAELFQSQGIVDDLIIASGGHVRDLIRLLNYSLAETQGKKKIDQDETSAAMHRLATEYRRLIDQDDYVLLAKIDSEPPHYTPNSDRTRHLLYSLVMLEYNSFWWQTHPVVRRLEAYQQARATLTSANS